MHSELDPATYGLTIWDLDREFLTDGVAGTERMKLGDLSHVLRDAYCRTVGHRVHAHPGPRARSAGSRSTSRASQRPPCPPTSSATSSAASTPPRRSRSSSGTKYVGQKRFGLEGAESAIPVLDAVLEQAADADLDGVVMGMAHRGRLNVLANIVGKSYDQIFKEFEGYDRPRVHAGLGRREVPPRPDRQVHRRTGKEIERRAGRQPERTSRPSTRSSSAWPGPSRTASTIPSVLGAADPRARRRRVRRPGRGRRDAATVEDQGLPRRWHDPPDHQQPARVHDAAGVGARSSEYCHRRREDGAGADLPRERRRPRGLRPRRPAGLRVPPARSTRTS